ncbi:hypothetical protein BU26DRAFT_569134 [Trematosphaeria pertusa]|uniref:CorA-like transporter domain-containing protein n=1 Tax=Trematosphaeria pertusa TaxID=390896 RepID=A0A6A6I1C8_9PLEO|nr:uncharacterized protein BU26DRAFT_569134 [Trematosphaeria pertusa]KAF2244131.1 hypothetical protein BU26DRAFT_569134 [Trematosphaeria pertusa]
MLSFLFSYHQVMPSFLDFVFPFGYQEYPQDFHFSGLQEESRLDERWKGTEIPQLGRSAQQLRFCYNLRSVEPSKSQSSLPWSIRQTAVYHSFDLQTGHSLWISVKGNKLIKNRITEASTLPSLSEAGTRSGAFSASLATHLLLCDWSGENWRWYINDLWDRFQELTRDALATPVDKPPSPIASPVPFLMSPRIPTNYFPPPSRATTGQFPGSPRSKFEAFSPSFPSRTTTLLESPQSPTHVQDSYCNHDKWASARIVDAKGLKSSLTSLYGQVKNIGHSDFWRHDNRSKPSPSADEKAQLPSPSPGDKQTPPELPPTFSEHGDEKQHETFTFSGLQDIQYIEEKAQEALLVIRLNAEVLEQLRQHYQYVMNHGEFPLELKADCGGDLARFDKCVLNVEKDLRMLQSRTETLLCLLANRKHLLNGILQYRSVKANESFAKKAHESATRMEMMTHEMHGIAKKTEQETVSMRVITTVTLFFLPATFIATFMSTDILKFEDGRQDFQIKGLRIYLAIALPMTAVTFFAWYIIYRRAKKAGDFAAQAHQDSPAHSDIV